MIRKRDLLEAIDDLTIQVIKQGAKIKELDKKLAGVEKIKKPAKKAKK